MNAFWFMGTWTNNIPRLKRPLNRYARAGVNMSRVINTNSPAKVRNRNRRTSAEILRRFGTKDAMDEEARDMAAQLVYALRAISGSVNQSVVAWEKRGYWIKADRFMREWQWSAEMAANVEDVLRNEAWDVMPRLLGELAPHLADIQIRKMTRPQSTWLGAYQKLLAEPPGDSPW